MVNKNKKVKLIVLRYGDGVRTQQRGTGIREWHFTMFIHSFVQIFRSINTFIISQKNENRKGKNSFSISTEK